MSHPATSCNTDAGLCLGDRPALAAAGHSTRDTGCEAPGPSQERLTSQEVAERTKKQQETSVSLQEEIRCSDFFRHARPSLSCCILSALWQ